MAETPELSLRIATDTMLYDGPPYLKVAAVDWDSGFAATGLQIADRIVAVNGQTLVKPDAPEEVSRWVAGLPGQTAENAYWRQQGAHVGQAVSLTVKRRAEEGWQTLTVQGELLEMYRTYSNAAGRRSLSSAGPDEMEYDGFDSSWSSWFSSEVPAMQKLLNDGWQSSWFSNRYELQTHLGRKARIDFLAQKYPGDCAHWVQALWEQTRAYLEGPKFEVTEQDLRWRKAEDERVQHAREFAAKAWADFQAAVAGDTVPAFPAVHPVRGDRKSVTGKYVVLPPVGNSSWVEYAGQTYFAFGSPDDGFYFADAQSEAARAMLIARERYNRIVTPYLNETYAFVGRIADNASLRMVGESGFYGLEVEIVAALLGDAMFVDLSQRQGTLVKFAGEDELAMPEHALPPDSASPREVMEAFVGTLKNGDMKLWQQLFADWSITQLDGGRLRINPHDLRINDNYWQYSRQSMVQKVYDLRVGWVDDAVPLTTGQEFEGAPKLDQVTVQLDTIGLFDGEYRRFGAAVNRTWQLQRVNGGPWRISSLQNL